MGSWHTRRFEFLFAELQMIDHDWNHKRIKAIIDHYGHKFFHGKRILDLGSGQCEIAIAFLRLGAELTCVDIKQEDLDIAKNNYQFLKIIKADLNHEWPFRNRFDMVLSLDLLSHLKYPEDHIRKICNIAEHVVLETDVGDSHLDSEDMLTSTYIQVKIADLGASYKRLDNQKLNSGSIRYDWQENNTGARSSKNRRMWFIRKDQFLAQQFENNNRILTSQALLAKRTVPTSRPPLATAPLPHNVYFPPPIMGQPVVSGPLKDLRVALCISGHLRTFEQNFISVREHILNRFNCDVFIHTWDTLGMPYRQLDSRVHNIKTDHMVETINRIYAPKKLIIEPTKRFLVSNLMHKAMIDYRDIPGILSMFYKIEVCNNIKSEYERENNFLYDIVIRFRGDLCMMAPLPINQDTNLNRLFIPQYGNFSGLCDQFAFGSSQVMDIYSSLYSNLEKHLETGAKLNPEKILLYHVEANHLLVEKSNVKFVIKRSNGLVQDNYLLERAWGFVR